MFTLGSFSRNIIYILSLPEIVAILVHVGCTPAWAAVATLPYNRNEARVNPEDG